jgi:hypothetical protein
MKVLKQHGLMWKPTKNFVMVVFWKEHIGRASELGQTYQAQLENRLMQMCVVQ